MERKHDHGMKDGPRYFPQQNQRQDEILHGIIAKRSLLAMTGSMTASQTVMVVLSFDTSVHSLVTIFTHSTMIATWSVFVSGFSPCT